MVYGHPNLSCLICLKLISFDPYQRISTHSKESQKQWLYFCRFFCAVFLGTFDLVSILLFLILPVFFQISNLAMYLELFAVFSFAVFSPNSRIFPFFIFHLFVSPFRTGFKTIPFRGFFFCRFRLPFRLSFISCRIDFCRFFSCHFFEIFMVFRFFFHCSFYLSVFFLNRKKKRQKKLPLLRRIP